MNGKFISLFALVWMDRGSLKLQILPQAIVITLLAFLGFYAM